MLPLGVIYSSMMSFLLEPFDDGFTQALGQLSLQKGKLE